MTKLLEHFKRMQAMCAAYVCPEPYQPQTGMPGTDDTRSDMFANDMIYMLDGPEQREAQLAASKLVDDLHSVHAVAMAPGNAHADHYLRGMANGLELAMAIVDGREPVYVVPNAVAPQGGVERILAFHSAFGLPINVPGYVPTTDERLLRGNLMLEEVLEHLINGLGLRLKYNAPNGSTWIIGNEERLEMVYYGDDYNPVETLDGLVDVKVIANGTGVAFGLPVEAADRMVFESNMSKLDENGKPIINGVTPGYRANIMTNPPNDDTGFRPDLPVGKVLKPATFVAPDIASLLPQPAMFHHNV